MDHCEFCSNYVYDEEFDCYECVIGLDEDEMARFMQGLAHDCPYFMFNDEYVLAAKQ